MGQNDKRALLASMLVLAFATLALASAPRWAAAIGSALAVLALVPLASSRRSFASFSPLLLMLLVPLVATGLQLLPLPTGLVAVVAPARYALAEANASAYSDTLPAFLSLSQDWPATLVAFSTFIGFASFAYVCLWLSASRQGKRTLLVSVVAIGSLVAICALGHRALGAESLFGLYKPHAHYKGSVSPFLNPNHLAQYMSLVTPVALGLAIHRKSWLFFGLGLVCATTSLQAVSRAGTISLFVGVIVAIVIASLCRKNTSSRRRAHAMRWPTRVALLAMLVLVPLVLGALIGGTSAFHELFSLDLQQEKAIGKLAPWWASLDLIRENPWFGVGRGAFEHSFTSVQPSTGVTFSHIENEYLQVVLDWGVPTALAIAVSLGLFIRPLLRRPEDALAAGGVGAFAALLVHSTVDFGLELPGMALPAIAVLATLAPVKLVVEKNKARSRIVQYGRLASIAIAICLCAVAFSQPGKSVTDELAGYEEYSSKSHASADQVIATSAQLSRRHPASYLVPARAARALWQRQDVRAFGVLARAIALNPNYFAVHLLTAQILASSQKPEQALGAYRRAMSMHGGSHKRIVQQLLSQFSDASDLLVAIPTGDRFGAEYAEIFLGFKRPDVTELIVRRARQLRGKSLQLLTFGVNAALLNSHPLWAMEVATEAYETHTNDVTLLLLVKTQRTLGLPLQALEAINTHQGVHASSNLDITLVRAQLQLEVGDHGAARESLGKLLSAKADAHRMNAHLQLAKIEEIEGNRHQAEWHRGQAEQLSGR